REGVELALRCGAFGLAGRANEEIAATGARPRTALQTGLDALPTSERRGVGGGAGGLGDEEKGDRPDAVRHDQDGRGALEPRLSQARDQLPRPARERSVDSGAELGPCLSLI